MSSKQKKQGKPAAPIVRLQPSPRREPDERAIFDARLSARRDELKWLYMELYHDEWHFQQLCDAMWGFYCDRSADLKALDRTRERTPNWYRSGKMLGMTMYARHFAGGLKGVLEHLDWLSDQHITYLHLMPLLKMPLGDNDGGYAVEDFRQVDPRIGTNEDLTALTAALRERGISLCLDFVANHTADTHDWAMRAKAGDPEYQARYFCYDDDTVPKQFEKTVPQVFPATAPGNFTWNGQMGKHVMTTFYPYQWDLNYQNPTVFNEMVFNLLFLADLGVEILRLDATPYLWKQLGTSCRNLPQVHSLVRMIRIVTEIVCPGVLLKGEVVMAPGELPAYFGTPEKPECHLLYSVSGMVDLWASLATRDMRLLKWQLDGLNALPGQCWFVNYLRCHDDVGWGLDEDAVKILGWDPLDNKKFLYHFYEGDYPGSFARGELYNYDARSQDARTCGTTASLCGVEKGGFEGDGGQVETGIQRVLLMHAAMMSFGGFPMLNSGDEIAQLNDYGYHDDPAKRSDSRNLHRGDFNWDNAALVHTQGTTQQRVYDGLAKLEWLRAAEPCFGPDASVSTWDTQNNAVLAVVRRREGGELVCLANFSPEEQTAHLACLPGARTDLLAGGTYDCADIKLPPYGRLWLKNGG